MKVAFSLKILRKVKNKMKLAIITREQTMNKIAFLLRDLGQGGAERSALRLANGLSRSGRAVCLLLLKAEGPMLTSVHSEIEVVDLKGSFLNLLGVRFFEFRSLPLFPPSYLAIRQRFPDGLKILFCVSVKEFNRFKCGKILESIKIIQCDFIQ